MEEYEAFYLISYMKYNWLLINDTASMNTEDESIVNAENVKMTRDLVYKLKSCVGAHIPTWWVFFKKEWNTYEALVVIFAWAFSRN